VNILSAASDAVRARGGLVVAQLNPRMLYTYGDAVLPCDEVDYAIEADEPLTSPVPRPVSDVSRQIGEQVAGATEERQRRLTRIRGLTARP
jgi:hypothetical protein